MNPATSSLTKAAIRFCLVSLLCLVGFEARALVTNAISQLPRTTTASSNDLMVLDQTNAAGASLYITKGTRADTWINNMGLATASSVSGLSNNIGLTGFGFSDFILGTGQSAPAMTNAGKGAALRLLEPTSPGFAPKQWPLFLNNSNTALNILTIGDSYAYLGAGYGQTEALIDALVGRYGWDGYSLANWQSTGIPVLAGGSVYSGGGGGAGDLNSSYLLYVIVSGGSTITWSNGCAGVTDGAMRCANAGLYYETGPGQGSFSVSFSTNGGAFSAAATVNAAVGSGILIAFTNFPQSSLNRILMRVTSVSGTNNILGAQFALGNAGVNVEMIANNGVSMTTFSQTPRASIDCLLTNMNPSIILHSSLELGFYGGPPYTNTYELTTNLVFWRNIYKTDCPNADIIWIGPCSTSNDTSALTALAALENQTINSFASSNGDASIDMSRVWTYPVASNFGLMYNPTHPGSNGCALLATYQRAELPQPDSGAFPVVYTQGTNWDGNILSRVMIGTDFPFYTRIGPWPTCKFLIHDTQIGFGTGNILAGCPADTYGGFAFAGSNLNSTNAALLGNSTYTLLQAPLATGGIFFYNRAGLIPNSGFMGGYLTNGALYVGNNSGAILNQINIPAKSVSADGGFLASGQTGLTYSVAITDPNGNLVTAGYTGGLLTSMTTNAYWLNNLGVPVNLYLDARFAGLVTNGGTVTWPDLGPNGWSLTNQAPTYAWPRGDQTNGGLAIHFFGGGGAGRTNYLCSSLYTNNNSPHETFVVFNDWNATANSFNEVFSSFNNSARNYAEFQGSFTDDMGAPTAITGQSWTAGNWRVMDYQFNAGTGTMVSNVNSAVEVTGAIGSQQMSGFVLADYGDLAAGASAGINVKLVADFGAILSATTRSNVWNQLTNQAAGGFKIP